MSRVGPTLHIAGIALGMLMAYYVAGKGLLKNSAPGAMIIHFLGGIHEIYFPYVLAHPVMILSMWAGGITADFWFVIMDAGLVATPSPGSSLVRQLARRPRQLGWFPPSIAAVAAAVLPRLGRTDLAAAVAVPDVAAADLRRRRRPPRGRLRRRIRRGRWDRV